MSNINSGLKEKASIFFRKNFQNTNPFEILRDEFRMKKQKKPKKKKSKKQQKNQEEVVEETKEETKEEEIVIPNFLSSSQQKHILHDGSTMFIFLGEQWSQQKTQETQFISMEDDDNENDGWMTAGRHSRRQFVNGSWQTLNVCERCEGNGHQRSNCPLSKCNFCNQWGHQTFVCPNK